ncbi:MAG: MaoC/PaaZ C-terminal domain-containing protein [bacterium]
MNYPDWVAKWLEPRENTVSYTWKDVVLYALGIGAEAEDLDFVYEGARGGLKVYPSFAGLLAGAVVRDFVEEQNPPRVLHGEQHVRVMAPLPPQGQIKVTGRITDVFDKGKAAVIHFISRGSTMEGEPLFEVKHVAFYLGAGGFGGASGPKSKKIEPPVGEEPSMRFMSTIPGNQAALYRLCGDLNPLHIDPDVAQKVGFSRPILHGMCTFGYATRALINGLCRGDVGLFKEFGARFTDVVYPGDTLITEAWHKGQGQYIVQARTQRSVVLGNGLAILG